VQPFVHHRGRVAPLDRANVDTDAIIPKQYLKSIKRTGFGAFLFDDWRYLDPGDLDVDPAKRRPNPAFLLNQPRFQGTSILLARDNFGCGSSREHAVWALHDAGFRVVIAPSFADIFYSNCFKNAFLAVVLPGSDVEALFAAEAQSAQGLELEVDLPAQRLRSANGTEFAFEIDAARKAALVEGLDEIGRTLRDAEAIRAYETRRREQAPWLFA
jgi:3-isopropylmalate/(R)-2-methylmalate dehydratase small subunit